MEHQGFEVEGLYVEFVPTASSDSGYPLLFVHGAWGGSWLFTHYLTYLSAGGWNCYAMNLRGHYQSAPASQPERVTLTDYVRDVIRVVHQLPFPPVLIGFGTSAHILQVALSKHIPALGAVFVSANGPTEKAPIIPPSVLTMPRLIPAEPILPAPDIHPETLTWLNDQRINTFEARAVLVELITTGSRISADFVKVPYLVLNGALDEDIAPQESAALAGFFEGPGSLEIIPGASHTGILVGTEWREAANALHAWLCTTGFNQRTE
jgi:pimeloyl-ACP methyl ester carboxylesterase